MTSSRPPPSAGSFTTLAKALEAAGLVETLKGEGPFTVFAPTDEAFAKLPEGTLDALLKDKEKLTAILTYHVVPGKVTAEQVAAMTSAKTVNGKELNIAAADGKVTVGKATVTPGRRSGHQRRHPRHRHRPPARVRRALP